jgi:amino acid permease
MLHERSGNQRITYYSASQATYPRARLLIDGAIALKCFGVAMSYLVVIGDLAPQVAGFLVPSLSAVSPLRNRNFYIASSALLIAPLAFQRTLHSIRFASYMSLVWMAYLLFIVGYFFISARVADEPWPEIDMVPRDWSILPNLPIFVFSFTCHQNLFTIYSELPNAAGARINKVVKGTVGTAILLYLLFGIGGYLTYGVAVSGDLLESYPKDVVSTIARMGIVFNVALSYPLQCNPARRSFTAIFFKGDSSAKPTPAQEDRQFVALTVAMLIGTYGIAFSGINLSLVFSIVGALGSTSICYVLPGLFYWKLTEGTTSVLRYAAASMIGVGLCITTVSMTMIVVSGGGGGI